MKATPTQLNIIANTYWRLSASEGRGARELAFRLFAESEIEIAAAISNHPVNTRHAEFRQCRDAEERKSFFLPES